MNLPLCLFAILLMPLAAAGLALIHQGLGRSRSAAHAMLATLCALAIAAIVLVTIGFSFAGFAGGMAHAFSIGGAHIDWLGAEPLFAAGIRSETITPALVLCFQIFAVGIAAIIPISGGSDRWRLGPTCIASALLAAFAYPLFAHWVWGGGWLGQLGSTFGLPPFTDMGGAGVIQAVGGLMALSVVWILGPRRGKYSDDGMATAIPGHNIVLVLLGCLLALVGWVGMDAAASMLFYAATPEQVVIVVINAMLSASAGALAVVVTTRIRYRKPDASLSANGWIAGLVAGSAGCGLVSPSAAILIGVGAGVLVAFMVELLELRLLIDDPGGAVSVHAGAGLLGLLAYGVFGPSTAGSLLETLLAQLVGVAALLGFMFPLIHAGNLLLNRFFPFRVDRDGDWQGMDIRELRCGRLPPNSSSTPTSSSLADEHRPRERPGEGRSMKSGFTRRPKKVEEPPANHDKNYITPGGLERLEEERRFLITKDRPAVVVVVAWAASNGDRSENADYQYSKRRLRQIDGRIRFLTKRIEAAEVVDPEAPRTGQRATRAFFGATVRYANATGAERVVSIVGTDEVDMDRGHISWASPLGRALMKAAEDDEVILHAPGGSETLTVLEVRYERIAVEPFREPTESDVSTGRPEKDEA